MKRWLIFLLIPIWVGSGCAAPAEQNNAFPGEGRLKAVATTTIVGDVVAQIGGDWIDLKLLLPVGTDPHSFDATPQDVALIAEAQVVFANGAGLEEFLEPLIENAGAGNRVVEVSQGIEFIDRAEISGADEDRDHEHNSIDPHTWTDPNNVMIWVTNISSTLSEIDPRHADAYRANAAAYRENLAELDSWIRTQVEQIPVSQRQIVTDHTVFSYFAEEYGFAQIGAIVPGYSTLAEPTARELATLEDAIRALDVRAVFVGNTVNPGLAERVAADTGVQLVSLYTGSLTNPEGDAGSYIDYIQYNVRAITDALK